jgi:proteasome lid subunit RPN8/RPN11
MAAGALGLRLSAALQAEVVAHCRSRYPKEACGLLAGQGGTVSQVYPMRNVEDSPIGYAMDPREQLQIEKQMRKLGQQLLGIFHSHTASAAYPSSVDVRLALSPELSYVLVSLQDQAHPEVKSYRIDGQQITPEPVTLA